MTRRCLKSLHNHRATRRDNRARRIIKLRIKGKMIGGLPGVCRAWFWRAVHGRHRPLRMSARRMGNCLISARQVLP